MEYAVTEAGITAGLLSFEMIAFPIFSISLLLKPTSFPHESSNLIFAFTFLDVPNYPSSNHLNWYITYNPLSPNRLTDGLEVDDACIASCPMHSIPNQKAGQPGWLSCFMVTLWFRLEGDDFLRLGAFLAFGHNVLNALSSPQQVINQ